MANCWQYVQKGDLRLCRHLFNCLTRLRLPVQTVTVTLRTPQEKRALLDPAGHPVLSERNPNGFRLDDRLAVVQCHWKLLQRKRLPLRKRMFLAKVGDEVVEPHGDGELDHLWQVCDQDGEDFLNFEEFSRIS